MFLKDSNVLGDNQKAQEVLALYAELMKTKVRNLREQTYAGVVELFLRNGNLNHASYFLCQMDRLKIQIPRKLLDMFLDYSISKKLFEKSQEEELFEPKPFKRQGFNSNQNNNKFDSYSQEAPEFNYYFTNKNRYQSRIDDLNKVYKQLKVDAKPFIPKRIQEQQAEQEIKKNLADIDISKVKEYIPKNYIVVKNDN